MIGEVVGLKSNSQLDADAHFADDHLDELASQLP